MQEYRLNVKDDFVFKKIFSQPGNEKFLKEFLSCLLSIDIKEIDVRHDVALEKNIKKEKLGILDIRAIINNDTNIILEMQNKNEYNIIKRSTYYASRMISEQLLKKQKYNNIHPVIVIFIMNFNYFKHFRYQTKSITVEQKNRKNEINKNIIYYYIELPKFRKKSIDINNKVEQWLLFIDGENREEMEKAMERNELIREAADKLEELEANDEVRRLVELRRKYRIDMNTAIDEAGERGKKEGVKQGNSEAKKDIAKKMLKKNIDIAFISEVTGLSKNVINKLNKREKKII